MKIKFANINIWQGGRLLSPLLKFLKDQDADIVTLQEVYDGKDSNLEERFRTVEVFSKALNYPHYHFAPTYLENLGKFKIDSGSMIMSKHPIIDTKKIYFFGEYGECVIHDNSEFGLLPRTLQKATVKIEDQEMNVFNIHGIWDPQNQDDAAKLKMSQTIIDETKGLSKVILAGDFNINPHTKTIDLIEEHLTNVLKDEYLTGFNMKQKTNPGYANAVVDMIFISQDVQVLSKACLPIDISDHLPLVCEFEI